MNATPAMSMATAAHDAIPPSPNKEIEIDAELLVDDDDDDVVPGGGNWNHCNSLSFSSVTSSNFPFKKS